MKNDYRVSKKSVWANIYVCLIVCVTLTSVLAFACNASSAKYVSDFFGSGVATVAKPICAVGSAYPTAEITFENGKVGTYKLRIANYLGSGSTQKITEAAFQCTIIVTVPDADGLTLHSISYSNGVSYSVVTPYLDAPTPVQDGGSKVYTFTDNSATDNHLRYKNISTAVEKYFSINFTASTPGTYNNITVEVIATQID